MKCECGGEFTGNFCPYCGKPVQTPSREAVTQRPEEKPRKSIWDKLAVITDKKTRLCAGFALGAAVYLFSGYIFTGIAFGASAFLYSPYARKKYPSKRIMFMLIAWLLFFLGLAVAGIQMEPA